MLGAGVLAPVPGATVQLTIDGTIQSIADDALAHAVRANQALAGVAVVIDVETGVVLAMANAPTYDANVGGPERGERNRAVTDEYEIGSIMKVFTIAAALDTGAVRVNQWWDVEKGSWRIADRTIRDTHYDEVLSTAGIFKRSSNVGAAKIGLRLGKERLYEGLLRFGFGTRSGIEVPGERVGKLRDPAKWRDIDVAAISYGYGMTVTPLQMAAGLAAVGNGGVYRAPRIVDRVIHADGSVDVTIAPEPVVAIKPETAAALLPILASVFDGGKQAGTAANVWVPGFTCGGKTGTVHKIDPATRGYSRDRYISSFGGLAPIKDPKLAIVVIVDEPSGGDYYGGKVAGPVFATIASESLRYLGVPGDAPLDPPKAKQAQIKQAQARADRKVVKAAAAAAAAAAGGAAAVPPVAVPADDPSADPDPDPGPVLAP
jgi:cell division protein FtsI (penicillin-binding protein 3)